MKFETERLFMRELCIDDVTALQEINSHPQVTRFMAFDPQSLQQTREYIQAAVSQQSDDPRRTFDMAIVLRSQETSVPRGQAESELIGRCGLEIRRPEHREAVVWYALHPDHWGSGYAVEAATSMIAAGFESFGLHRIWADCDPRNEASCRVAVKLGMQFEGRIRENYYLKGEWCSTSVYGILEHEWQVSKA